MYNPVTTYRIQFNNKFTFDHLETLLPYLEALGIKTIYASPVFAATPNSQHGYDGVDSNRINPEIGTHTQLLAISQRLRQSGMGWLQDIVPNHMAYHPDNEWLTDVLEKGPVSRFAQFFDTSLASSFFHGRIMAPFLPQPIDDTLAQGALTLAYQQRRLVLEVNGNVLPLRPESYAAVLQAATSESNDAVGQLLNQIDQLRPIEEPEAYALAWEEIREQLTSLMKAGVMNQAMQAGIAVLNNDPAALKQLIEIQHYRFCTEPESRQMMNYRRFFTINGLICLNMRDEMVFGHVHQLIKDLVDEGVFQGLRVDHVDGLFDPAGYLAWLRQLVSNDTYLVVEKILQSDEDLPTDWPIEGTSGYEFLALINNLLTNAAAEPAFRDFYQQLIGTETSLPNRIRDRKAYFLAQYMGGELDNLFHYFLNLNLADEQTLSDLTTGTLRLTIGELLVRCPVYRYYGNVMPLPPDEAKVLQQLIDSIRQTEPNLTMAADVLETALLQQPLTGDDAFNQRALRFYQRLMQFSSPLMAKGVEDTLLYTYNCFMGHNEVGDSPERFGLSMPDFHRAMQHRQTYWPLAQNTTSTHDTKRGEDVRARLNVLTDLADTWLAEVAYWQELNSSLKQEAIPDANDEYFIYQNLLGGYPMPEQDEDDFPNRFHLYLEKSLQEAKRHTTGWVVEDDYHDGTQEFVKRLLNQQGPFWKRFTAFHRQIADFGIVNALAQTALKITCPGVPDIYQGCEGWDLSLVDPDNRRPVDFGLCQQWLADLTSRQQANDDTIWGDLWQNRWDGRIKFWLTHTLLNERSRQPELFAQGEYLPLPVGGTYQQNVLAFARRYGSVCYVVVVPLRTASLCQAQNTDVSDISMPGTDVLALDWQDTHVTLPPGMAGTWTDCLTNVAGNGSERLSVQSLLSQLPVALVRFSDAD